MISNLLYRVRVLFRPKAVGSELDEELRAHFERLVETYVHSGMKREAARRRAQLEFGGLDQVKEACRDAWGVSFIETTIQDIRYGLRMLAKKPAFTAVAVLTLALGIGATTAIFSVVEAVLLHASPYRSPGQLVEIREKGPQGEEAEVSAGDFTDWQEQCRAFQGLAAYKQWEFHTLTGVREPDEVWASPVSANLFPLLGINAVLGRTFVPSESQAVLLSYQYWRSHFSSDPELVGKSVTLDGKPYTVVGIAPAEFEFPAPNAQVWIPLTFSVAEKNDHENRSLGVIARLKPGVSLKQAQAEIELAAHRLAMQHPKTNAGWSFPMQQYKGRQLGGVLQAAILALLGAVVFVQIIACVNVASMFLARGASRQGEVAVRAALGAGRWRIIRQLLVESLMLAGAASIAGIGVASSGVRLIVALVPKYNLVETQSVHRIAINLPVLGFTVALSLLTGIVVGLLPALRVSSFDLNDALKERGRASGTSLRRSVLQRVLVVSEVALALVLLVGAGLMIQSFERLASAPVGFNPDHVLTVRVPLARYKYSEGVQSASFYQEVLERIRAIPGVKSAAMANNLPFTGFHTSVDLTLPADSPQGGGGTIYVTARSVSPGYFGAMGTPFVDGRDFTPADNQSGAPCVRIINRALARQLWPGEKAAGKLLRHGCPRDASALIVGVVGDSKQDSVNSKAEPELYEPYAQHPFASFLVTFVIRTGSDPLHFVRAVSSAVWEVDQHQPVIQMRTMQNVIVESIWRQRFSASMLGVFATIALFLAAIGIYGVLSYAVSQRTHEIGIRSALGATRTDILRLVLGEGSFLALAGVAAGVAAALGLTRLLSALLYGVRPRDPLTLAASCLLLTGVAMLAVYIPARRATKVDPMVALRYE